MISPFKYGGNFDHMFKKEDFIINRGNVINVTKLTNLIRVLLY
jgi:hypothetical protein